MQLGNLSTDAAKDYGITFARQQYVAGLADDHPDKAITDFDYIVARIGSMVDSWAHQADLAAATPPVPVPGGVSADWRPQAQTDLNAKRAAILSVLTTMQTSYEAKGLSSFSAACMTVKDGLLTIEQSAGVVAAYTDPIGTRAAFDTAVKTAWLTLVAPVPAQVKSDYPKYGGSTL